QWALDLTPLIHDPKLDITEYTLGFVERLKQDIAARLKKAL
ncbi:MAG: hypothetical protein RIR91_286, partial [Verrucomicrobiota bacterium]